MTREELGKKIEETWIELDKAKNVIYLGEVRKAFLQLFDQWTADVIGKDMEIITGTTATSPTRSLPGNPGNEHVFAFEDGFNRRGAEARKRAGECTIECVGRCAQPKAVWLYHSHRREKGTHHANQEAATDTRNRASGRGRLDAIGRAHPAGTG